LFGSTESAGIVGNDWEVEVVETHHTTKKDAPSGTAKRLQEILKQSAARSARHALRIGDVVGDHTVTFGAPGERIELTHARAVARRLRAARSGRPSGR